MTAHMYDNGDGVNRDNAEAERYYQLAADQGDDVALYTLGMLRLSDAIDAKDEPAMKLAAEYVIRAADKGHMDAQTAAGGFYTKGLGVDVNKAKGFAYYRQSAEQGCGKAQCKLGSIYHHGEGVAQNPDEALRYYKMAADQGNLFAQYWAAELLEKQASELTGKLTETAEAEHYFKLAADQGHRFSACKIAQYYLMRDSSPKRAVVDEGLRYLYFALRHGEVYAKPVLAYCYCHGVGMEQDRPESVRILQEAAEQGSSMACELLARLHRTGEQGVPLSMKEAQRYDNLIAEQKRQGKYTILPVQDSAFWKLYK